MSGQCKEPRLPEPTSPLEHNVLSNPASRHFLVFFFFFFPLNCVPSTLGTLTEALCSLPDSGPCQSLLSEVHSGQRSRSLQSGLGATPRHIPASLPRKQSWGNNALCRATTSRSPEAPTGTLQLAAAAETHPCLWGVSISPCFPLQ